MGGKRLIYYFICGKDRYGKGYIVFGMRYTPKAKLLRELNISDFAGA